MGVKVNTAGETTTSPRERRESLVWSGRFSGSHPPKNKYGGQRWVREPPPTSITIYGLRSNGPVVRGNNEGAAPSIWVEILQMYYRWTPDYAQRLSINRGVRLVPVFTRRFHLPWSVR